MKKRSEKSELSWTQVVANTGQKSVRKVKKVNQKSEKKKWTNNLLHLEGRRGEPTSGRGHPDLVDSTSSEKGPGASFTFFSP